MGQMKPILFNTPMVQAILDGRKTQTRRVVKGKLKKQDANYLGRWEYELQIDKYKSISLSNYKYEELIEKLINEFAKYKKGDILNVVEAYPITCSDSSEQEMMNKSTNISLKVTDVRVERLQDITWDDAKAEGVKAILDYNDVHPEIGMPASDYFTPFETLWNSTSKDGYKWEDNPYAFVYEFERVEKPKDEL